MKHSKISRRSFLLGLGAVSTAALLAACGEAASSAPASSAASSEAPASSASEVPTVPILTEDEFPVTDGSTAMFNRYSVYSQSFGHFFSIEALYIN